MARTIRDKLDDPDMGQSMPKISTEEWSQLHQEQPAESTTTTTAVDSVLNNTDLLAELDAISAMLYNIDERLLKLERLQQCTCGAFAKGFTEHQPFCQFFEQPPRMRDCYKCGRTGLIETSPKFVEQCPVCHGAGIVQEYWLDGKLVWPDQLKATLNID